MHLSFCQLRRSLREAKLRAACMLAILLLLPNVSATAQGPQIVMPSSTPSTAPGRQPDNGLPKIIVPKREDEDEKDGKKGAKEGDGVSTKSEEIPSPNPFNAQSAGPIRHNLIIPVAPDDGAKVVNNENGLISLVIREGSLRQVVSMIANTQKLNIVFVGSTDTLVTAAFERQPWQTVLDSLLAASGYTWSSRGDVIFVTGVEAAEFLPPDTEGRKVAVFDLDFASAVDVDQTVKGLLSPAGESWLVETSSNDNRRTKESIAVLDYPQHIHRIEEYIVQADQPPRQVYIQAHILQIELTDDCKNGINFENIARWSSAGIASSTPGFASATATPSLLVDVDGVGLDGIIELLKTTNDVKTLASPEIHAVSGQESHIQIGERLGYKVTTTTQTSSLESAQFLEVGVVLRVTPRVTRDGRVLMRILPKVSTGVVNPDTGLPSEKTTQVETDVMLCSGQGMLIGGLIQETDSNIQSKIPLLGDIPYAGVLFQKRNVVRSRKEIVVTLQPHILPYSPDVQDRNDHQFMRTTQPLTHGAIDSFPRPYEPRMPDALEHHKRKKEAQLLEEQARRPVHPAQYSEQSPRKTSPQQSRSGKRRTQPTMNTPHIPVTYDASRPGSRR